jgi:hypothetical protein
VSLLSRRRHRREVVVEPPAERPEVRSYRYLLRTADVATMERLHAQALAALDPLVRAHILRTAQDRLLSGRDLTVDDVARIARLFTVGERQTPGILIGALTDIALERLAHAVLRIPQAQGLLEGYAAWDGSDTPPRPATSVTAVPPKRSDDLPESTRAKAAARPETRAGGGRRYASTSAVVVRVTSGP